jgi:hypothetical protein
MTSQAAAAIANRERQARWRQRQARDACVLHVEVNRDRLLYQLIDRGWISESDCWRRDLVEHALSQALDRCELPEARK